MPEDYYQILGLNNNASQEQVKAAYRKLAFQYHPDRNKEDPAAGERMKKINEAYAVLSDPGKRKKYDAYRDDYGSTAAQRFRESHSEADIFRDSDINQIFEEMSRAFGFRNADDIFKEFYGSRYQTFTFRRPGVSGRGFISFYGFRPPGEQQGRFQGQGKAPSFPTGPLAGILSKFLKGRVEKAFGIKFPEKGRDMHAVLFLTPEQASRGEKVKYYYQEWGKQQKIMVKVPPGMQEGQKIRLRGLGGRGKNGGENGDLYLKVKMQVPLLQKIKRLFRRGY
ncbi:MAG: J domain-containing protein [Firmicutes bacterium]|nr:J domain-containing protein [Bacillota bacterium]